MAALRSRTNFQMEPDHREPKKAFQKLAVQPRPALGNIINRQKEVQIEKKPSTTRDEIVVVPKAQPADTKEPAVIVIPSPEAMDMAEAFSELSIDDIDTQDFDNPQLCAEYVKDIYKYIREQEVLYQVDPNYIKQQPEVTERMRSILIDWLIQVHLRFSLLPETLYLTVTIIDRYLAVESVKKSELQLVGVTAMLIASKYEEMYAPEVRDFVYITDNTYSSEKIRRTEVHMLQKLDYMFGNPLCLHFLRRNSKAGEVTPEIHTMAKFLMELSLVDYAMLAYPPSTVAAASLCLAMKLLAQLPWNANLRHYSTYSNDQLTSCMQRLATLVSKMETSKQQAVRNKYASRKLFQVSKSDALKSRALKELVLDSN